MQGRSAFLDCFIIHLICFTRRLVEFSDYFMRSIRCLIFYKRFADCHNCLYSLAV